MSEQYLATPLKRVNAKLLLKGNMDYRRPASSNRYLLNGTRSKNYNACLNMYLASP